MKITKQIGKFWLPDSPWHRVYGEFELIKETLGRLLLFDVIDTFVSKAAYFNEHFQLMQHPLIIGKLKDGTGIALRNSCRQFSKSLRHHSRLKADERISYFAFQLRLGQEGCYRVDDDNIDSA